MRSRILVPGFAALALISANMLPATAKPVNEFTGVNTYKSARHANYRLIGSYTGHTHAQQGRIVVGKTDDAGGK
jgi:hypothetical protein